MNQNQLIYKEKKTDRQSNIHKQASDRDKPDMMIKGANKPFKQAVDNEKKSNIKEYKQKMQSHYSNIQAQRQAELDSKRNKILQEMNKKA